MKRLTLSKDLVTRGLALRNNVLKGEYADYGVIDAKCMEFAYDVILYINRDVKVVEECYYDGIRCIVTDRFKDGAILELKEIQTGEKHVAFAKDVSSVVESYYVNGEEL